MAVMFIVGDLKTDTNSLFRDILNIFLSTKTMFILIYMRYTNI